MFFVEFVVVGMVVRGKTSKGTVGEKLCLADKTQVQELWPTKGSGVV